MGVVRRSGVVGLAIAAALVVGSCRSVAGRYCFSCPGPGQSGDSCRQQQGAVMMTVTEVRRDGRELCATGVLENYGADDVMVIDAVLRSRYVDILASRLALTPGTPDIGPGERATLQVCFDLPAGAELDRGTIFVRSLVAVGASNAFITLFQIESSSK